MKRRHFIGTMGSAALGLGTLSESLRVFQPRQPVALRNWMWAHAGADRSAEEWRSALANLKGIGGAGVLVSGGDPGELSAIARDLDLQFHRWIWVLNRAGDAWARENHPEWFTVNRLGESSLDHPPYVGYYRWVCPTREPVRDYLRSRVAELASDPNVDGIHLDYIRHPDVILPRGLWDRYNLIQDREYPQFDYCYCEVCRETFRELHGVDPLTLDDPTANAEWKQFRWDSITRLVNELAAVANGEGKTISAAVFPTPSLAKLMVHQQWERWEIDRVFPMTYQGFYEEDLGWIEYAARAGVAAIPEDRGLYAGLFLPSLNPEELGRAVVHAARGGAAGVSFFELGGLSDAHVARVREVIDGLNG